MRCLYIFIFLTEFGFVIYNRKNPFLSITAPFLPSDSPHDPDNSKFFEIDFVFDRKNSLTAISMVHLLIPAHYRALPAPLHVSRSGRAVICVFFSLKTLRIR